MKFEVVQKTVEQFGVAESRAMTIANSGKMFHTLISGLYSRKIEAIVRESCANARDGHLKRGNTDRPFTVHAPSTWEPWYSVRDYGCSMPHDMVMDLYSTVGWSSKEDSNLENGTFGLGSKSPFAYTSQFALETYLNGWKRVYNCHLTRDGQPHIALMGEPVPTDEEDGVLVRINVKKQDIESFKSVLKQVALGHSPIFEANINVASVNIAYDFDSFYITSDVQGPLVQIGCIYYPIDFDFLCEGATDMEVMRLAAIKADRRFVLRAPIGSLGIMPNREGLQYTDETTANLKAMLLNLFKHYDDETRAEIAALTNVWDAAHYYRVKKDGTMFATIVANCQTPWGHLPGLRTFAFGHEQRDHMFAMSLDGVALRIQKERTTFDRASETTAVYVIDEAVDINPKFWRTRVKQHMATHNVIHAALIRLPDPNVVKVISRQMIAAKMDRKERAIKLNRMRFELTQKRKKLLSSIEEYGCPVVVDVIALPEYVREKRAPTIRLNNIAVYTPSRGNSFTRCVEAAEWAPGKDSEAFNLVVPLDRGVWMGGVESHHLRNWAHKLKNISIGTVVGVAKTNVVKFLKANPDFISFDEVFNESEFDLPALVERATALNGLREMENDDEALMAARLKEQVVKVLGYTPPAIQEFIDATAAITEKNKQIGDFIGSGVSLDTCREVYHFIAKTLIPAGDGVNPNKHMEERREAAEQMIFNRYPLLHRVIDMRENQGSLGNPRLVKFNLAAYVYGVEALLAMQPAESELDEAA